MKKALQITLFFVAINSFSQEKRVPAIVVLSPQELIFDKELDSIAKLYERKGELTEEQKVGIRESNGGKFPLKSEKEILFMENLNLGAQITYGLNFYFSYKLFEYHQNHIVYPAHEDNNSTKGELKKISDKHDMNWVVNIPKVEFLIKKNGKTGEIHFQLYNQKFDKIVLDEILTVKDQNPGFTFACESGTITCVINNMTSSVSNKVLGFLNKNRKYWR